MKKTVSLLLITAMLCALIPFSAISVFAADSEITDSQGVMYTLGGNGKYYIVSGCDRSAANVVIPGAINGLPVVLPSDVSAPQAGCEFLGIKGKYITQIQESLDLINQIRYEACSEGVISPATGKPLTLGDYVPLEWSSDLEYIARIRAAEASVTMDHARTNGNSIWFKGPGGTSSNAEVIAWNWGETMTGGINQWYREKSDWVNKTGGVTGHYTSMINPNNRYVGLGTFCSDSAKYYNTTAGEFSRKNNNNDTSRGYSTEIITQIIEVKNEHISFDIAGSDELYICATATFYDYWGSELKTKGLVLMGDSAGKVLWSSSDENIVSVSNGRLTVGSCGDAVITAKLQDGSLLQKSVSFAHSYKTDVIAATCTVGGYTTHTCTRCGDSYKDSYTNALGHKPGSAATCTTDQVCTVCKEVLTVKLGHDYKAVVIKPTCEAKGHTTHTCSRCNDSYIDTYTDALGHDYKSVVTKPTCEEKGYTTHTCTRCGDSYKDGYTNALGHKPGSAATCTTDQNCTVCGKVIAEKLGHDYKSVVTAPTCEEKGYTTHTCTRCGDSYKDGYTNALGHKPGSAATCTTDQVCTVCKEVLTVKLGHDYKAVVTKPTCEAKGHTTHTCSRCNDSYIDTYTDALGHDYKSVVTKPDCEHGGYTTHTCPRCGDSYVDTYTDALGHKPGSAATCTTDQVCTVCGKVIKEKLGHDYKSVVTAPTCEEKGYTTHTCSRCGDSYIDSYTDALGHTAGDWVTVKEAANGEDGLKEKHCTVCGKTVESEIIPGYIKGDINGNGKVDSGDYALAKRHVLRTFTLTGNAFKAADLNGDGRITANEYGLIKRHVLGTYVIE